MTVHSRIIFCSLCSSECGFCETQRLLFLSQAVTYEEGQSKLHTVSVRADLRGRGLASGHQAYQESLRSPPQCQSRFCQQSPPQTTAIYITSLLLGFLALNSDSDCVCTCALVRLCPRLCMSKRLCAIETQINYSSGKSEAS